MLIHSEKRSQKRKKALLFIYDSCNNVVQYCKSTHALFLWQKSQNWAKLPDFHVFFQGMLRFGTLYLFF